jgi:hypothetical protein
MLFNNTTFLGIDPTAGQRPIAYTALDNELNLLALGQSNTDDVLAFAAGQQQTVVGVCAPRRLNQGIMTDPEVRKNLSPPPHPGRWENFRMADYLIRQHNITIPQTPRNEKDCPNWMRMGFVLYRRMENLGYRTYPCENAMRQYLEVYPHACYTVLLGVAPFSKYTLEGRLQRQLALLEQGIHVADPMLFFEEITKYKLLKGILPLEGLYNPGELDALAAAYTAWLAANHPNRVTILGDEDEGQVILPVAEIKTRY